MSGRGSTIVREVISSTSSGADVMSALPGLVRQLLDEEAWREFMVVGLSKPVIHTTFTSFLETAPPKGLGGRKRQLVALCGTDDVLARRVINLLDEEARRPKGGSDKIFLNYNNIIVEKDLAPVGTSRRQALRKLRKDAPGLHAEVLAGNLTAHAAMVQAGFRPRIFTVRPDPGSAARTLRKHLTPDQLAELARLLTEVEE